MIVGEFLQGLLEDGRPVFESADAPRDLGKPAEQTELLLVRMDGVRRETAPGDAPDFELPVAHAAAAAFCRLAQFTVYREIPAETIEQEWEFLAKPIRIESPTPAQIWSADVVLAHLPELFRIARNVAENDPLMKPIRDLAKWWSLSGAGVEGVEWDESDLETVLAHETLSGLLVDRILETRERSLAAMPPIRTRLEAAVGDFEKEFAPWLADVPAGLEETNEMEHEGAGDRGEMG